MYDTEFLRQLLTDDTITIYLVCTCPQQNKYFAHTNRDGLFFDGSRNVLSFMPLLASEQIFCTHKSGRIFLRRFEKCQLAERNLDSGKIYALDRGKAHLGTIVRVHSHAPSIRSHRGIKVVWPDFQPMRVAEEPVCVYLFRQKPVFTSLHLKSPVHFHRRRRHDTTRRHFWIFYSNARPAPLRCPPKPRNKLNGNRAYHWARQLRI